MIQYRGTAFILAIMGLFLFAGCSRSLHHERIYIPKHGATTDKEIVALAPTLPKKDTRLLIVIDAGHGGKDEGAKSIESPKYFEKNLTLSTAQMLNKYLQGFGYHTFMIRKDDTFVSLKDRANIANEKKSDLFVSVHFNAAENRTAHGIEVYYYNSEEDQKRAKDSKKLAAAVLDNVISNTKANSRGVKHGNLAVIRETNMPAILVEAGFVTNKDEMSKIREAEYMKKIAWGIAQGIKQYTTGKKG